MNLAQKLVQNVGVRQIRHIYYDSVNKNQMEEIVGLYNLQISSGIRILYPMQQNSFQ